MSRHKRVFRYMLIILTIFILGNIIIFTNAADATSINVNDFFENLDRSNYTLPEHVCKFRQVYDSNYHWNVCSICGITQNRVKHNLKTNGSWYVCNPGDANRFAARRGCECGYESKSIIVVHGRLDDYENENAGISNSGVTFKNIEKISYAEFKSHYSSGHGTTNGGNTVVYTFGNFEKCSSGNYIDTDLGYVFSGGPIGSGTNKKGTLGRLGISTSNDDYPELRTLVKFFERVPNGTKDDFVKLLETPFTSKVTISTGIELDGFQYNNINDSKHMLYGLINKYKSNVTYQQFEKLREELLGYTEHISSAGWRSDFIFCNHINPDIPSKKGCHANSGDFVSYYWNHGCNILGGGVNTNAAGITYCDMCGGDYPAYSCEQFQGLMIDLKGKEAGKTYNTTWGLSNASTLLKGTYTIHSLNPIIDVTLTVDLNGTGYQIVSAPSGWTIDKDNNTITMRRSEKTNGYDWQNSSMSWGWFSSGIMCISPHWGASGKPNADQAQLRFGIYYPYADNAAPVNTKLEIRYPSNGNKLPNTCLLNVEFTDVDDSRQNYVIYQVYEDVNCTKLIKGLDNEGKEIDTFTTVKTGGSGSNGDLGAKATYTSSVSLLLEVTNSKTIYVRGRDKVGNWSKPKSVVVSKVDSIAPQVKSKIEPSGWQKSKTVTYTIYDLFGEQNAGITGDNFDWKDSSFKNEQWNTSSIYDNFDGTGSTRKYIVDGNIGTVGRELIFYAQDGNGNLQSIKVNVDKLDNTSPTITSISMSELTDKNLKVKVNANDKMTVYRDKYNINEIVDGSGISKYAITNKNELPSESSDKWQESDVISIPSNGVYYIWCKDAVGNISSPRKIVINHYKEKDSIEPSDNPNSIVNDYEYVSDINVEYTDDNYYNTDGSNRYKNYNHHYTGYERYKALGDSDGGYIVTNNLNDTIIDIYYKRTRYTITYNGNTNSSGHMDDTLAKYDKEFKLPALNFDKEYIYNLDMNGGYIIDSDKPSELKETWTFKHWLFDNNSKKDSQLSTKNYDDEATIEKAISIKDDDIITLKAQWKPGSIILPNVKRDGCDFIGWFNVPQNEALDPNKTIYRLGDGGDKVTIEGTLRGVFDDKNNMTLYAWYDKKPIFINIYDGLFFEGQKVSYTDLLSMIGVWDYDKDIKNMTEEIIEKYFKDLIKSIDDEINDAKEDLQYIIEEKEDIESDGGDTSDYIEEITELREHLKKLLAKKDKIKEEYKKVKNDLKNIELEPTIAKIEYVKGNNGVATPSNATSSGIHTHDGDEHIDDYHIDEEANNGIKKAPKGDYDYDNMFLDTCSNSIGRVRVTYQVYNEPITHKAYWEDWDEDELEDDLVEDTEEDIEEVEIPGTDIALEYTRTYQINFNYNPLLRLQNMLYYAHTDFAPNGKLGEFVESRQALYDSEDLQDNLPWWNAGDDKKDKLLHENNSDTKNKLQGTIEVVGISNITFDSAYENKHKEEVDNFKKDYEKSINDNTDITHEDLLDLLDDIYALKYSTNDEDKELFSAIRSIGLTFDGYDQFGKYSSNKVSDDASNMGVYTDKRPLGYNKEFNGGYEVSYVEEYDPLIYQNDNERTVNLILVNPNTDKILISNRVFDRIRYINSSYIDTLGTKSYWGVYKHKSRLESILNKTKDNNKNATYEGTYKDKKGKEVNIKVYDYTD